VTPAARVQSAIELIDAIIAAARDNGAAADTIIARWFAARRYAGSKDRAAVRDLVYRAIRAFGEPPQSGRAAFVGLAKHDAVLAAAFDGTGYGPPVIEPGEPAARPIAMPKWLGRQIDVAEHVALLERAPLDLRVNRLKTTREAMLAHWPHAEPIAALDGGLRLSASEAVERSEPYLDGLVEVQDAGSQLVVAACRAAPGMTVVDLCAGGGGKTLALASAMGGAGRLVACDTDRNRLSRLVPRAAKAGADVTVRLLDPNREDEALGDLIAQADVVLLDAPCTGTGTLRRNPEARWRLTPDRLARVMALQAHILELGAPLVRPGGALVYAVCSLIEGEGAGQVARFLTDNPLWRVEAPFEVGRAQGVGRMLTPAHDATDGFFVARLIAPC